MARALRIEYEGAVYHVMCRGNNGQDIFLSDADRRIFLQTLEESCDQTGWRIHAYVLMGNHYHLLLETPEANLVAGMKWLQGTYTQRFNKRNDRYGHLFQGRYKSLIINPAVDHYFSTVGSYIHLNPVRAGMGDDPCGFAWSSCRYYADRTLKKPAWFAVERIYASLGLSGGERDQCTAYRLYIQARAVEMDNPEAAEEMERDWAPLRRGWVMGDEEFRNGILDGIEASSRGGMDNLRGGQRRMHGEHQAERYLKKALALLKITENELLEMKSIQPEKQAVAWLLKNYTVVTGVWIAERISMGHRVNASRAVGAFAKRSDEAGVQLREKMLQCTG